MFYCVVVDATVRVEFFSVFCRPNDVGGYEKTVVENVMVFYASNDQLLVIFGILIKSLYELYWVFA